MAMSQVRIPQHCRNGLLQQLSKEMQRSVALSVQRCIGKQQLWCSFDVLKDNLGGPRSTFPHTAFLVAGTQAPAGQPNSLEIMKLSGLSQGDHGRTVCVGASCLHKLLEAVGLTAPARNSHPLEPVQ